MKRSIFGYLEGDTENGDLRLSRKGAKHEAWSEAILPADVQAGSPETETNRRPLRVFAAVVTFAMGIVILRLFMLQIIDGRENLALAEGNRIRERVSRAPRGIIYDRTKVVLARNQASYDVVVVPQLLPYDTAERETAYVRLGEILGKSSEDIKAKAEADCKVQPKTCLQSPLPQLIATSVSQPQALLVEQSVDELHAFSLDVNPVREYPSGQTLSILLGYTGRVNAEEIKIDRSYGPTDLIGKLGIERQYEKLLRGENGGEQTEVDAVGRPVKVLDSRRPVPGHNLVLTIDSGLQNKLGEAIKRQLAASGSTRGAGVALNPKTGEVLASVSMPDYDNNLFARGISRKDYSRLALDPGQPLFDKATGGGYPSGSIIKPLVAAAALQERTITPQTSLVDRGFIDVKNENDPNAPAQRFRSYEEGGLGIVDLVRALATSSNVYFYSIGGGFEAIRGLGIERLARYYNLFGLGTKTGIDLPAETSDRVPTPAWKQRVLGEAWYKGDTFNTSVGQGNILVSPLQMAVATAAIANGGDVMKPFIRARVEDTNGKTVEVTRPQVVRSNFADRSHLAVVRQAMRQVVAAPYGTACCRIEQDVPVKVAAKTGTAESGGKNKPHAWFEAFAPYDDPQIVIVVLIERSGEGAQFAAPAVRETLQWYFTEGAGKR